MIFRRFYDDGLAQASYLLGCERTRDAIVIDPNMAIETYVRVMGIPEPLASTVATRTLVVLGQDLVPYRRRARDGDPGEDDSRPKLRLDDASDGRSRIRRA